MSLFRNRQQAGQQLARQLAEHEPGDDAIVLGLARGGVPVAAEVARILGLELDVFVVRKLGVPVQPELAFGALATGGARVLNERIISVAGLDDHVIDKITDAEREILEYREQLYRGDKAPPQLAERNVILVDDGVATGATMSVAVEAARQLHPTRIIGAVPVSPVRSCRSLAEEVDAMVCIATPEPFMGVGAWYDDFHQVDDDEVRAALGTDGSRPNAP